MTRPTEEDIVKLNEQLEKALTLKTGRSMKSIYKMFNCDQTLTSWKFNEWDYGRKVVLPINARGLFIANNTIVARGYDKFFNIGEVPISKVDWIKSNTHGPYEVTVKENGCIIFISGLANGQLVVCSKHSTGERNDEYKNHALAGMKSLEMQLEKLGMSSEDLAMQLYKDNLTAVCEFCDDTFEEHVIDYTNKEGLYLHGLNHNEIKFRTMPMPQTHEFAEKFGFKTIDFFTKNTYEELMSFLDQCSKDGHYKNTEIEGFVIRCHNNDGSDYFFKYKFEEPYLMYRQWREVTKKYIETKQRVYRFKKHPFITNKYLDFAIPRLEDPEVCKQFMAGKGIIKMRTEFLQSFGMTGLEIMNSEAVKNLEKEYSAQYASGDVKFILVPIATIGCGKTTTGLTLVNLFDDWAIVQNDDITSKDKNKLVTNALAELASKKVVIIDRNNHQFRERQQILDQISQLRDDLLPYNTNIQVIGVSFIPKGYDMEKLFKTTLGRVELRGDNHQSIKTSENIHKGIMTGFIKRYQHVNRQRQPDENFDHIINLTPESSLENAKTVVQFLKDKYGTQCVKSVDLDYDAAFAKALEYKPTVTKTFNQKPKPKGVKPAYFALSVPAHKLLPLLPKEIIKHVKVQKSFHVTLVHVKGGKNGTKKEKDLWSFYNQKFAKLLEKRGDPIIFTKIYQTIKLKNITWNDEAVCVQVETEKCANAFPHITIGTVSKPPFYSNELCQLAAEGKAQTQPLEAELDCEFQIVL